MAMTRRKWILGAAGVVGGLGIIKLFEDATRLPELPEDLKVKLIAQVEEGVKGATPNGMEFLSRISPGETEYYTFDDMKKNKQEIIGYIKSDDFIGGRIIGRDWRLDTDPVITADQVPAFSDKIGDASRPANSNRRAFFGLKPAAKPA